MEDQNIKKFIPALIIVDFQQDFCPPSGSLAVAGGRDIAPVVNHLLDLPFALKVATKDWHPPDHVSFATNHPPPDNTPFESTVTVANPYNASETETVRLWPVHCVQGSPGAELAPELAAAQGRVDAVVEKGTDARVEMFSAFRDPFRHPVVSDSGLAGLLRARGVTHVYVVGLAADFCVRFTALDAVGEGFGAVVVKEGTRAVDPSQIDRLVRDLSEAGVGWVSVDGEEVGRVKALGA